jgi:hypothetical protein
MARSSGEFCGVVNPFFPAKNRGLTRRSLRIILALFRFPQLRVAKAKFHVSNNPSDGFSDMASALAALVALMKKNLSEAAMDNNDASAASDLRDKWRSEEFYVEETDKV